MDSTVEKLLEIQDKDIRVFNLRKQIESVPVEKEKIKRMLAEAEENVAASKDKVLNVEKNINAVEIEIAAHQDKIKELQNKSTAIKKNEEYRALLNEIETHNKKIKGFEEVQLQYWEELEAAKEQRKKDSDTLAAAGARVDSALNDIDVRDRNCQSQIDKVMADRAKFAESIPEELLGKYTRIIATPTKSGTFRTGIVPVQNNNCGRCFLKVTPQIKASVRSNIIVACENCGVFLYRGE